MMVRWHFVLVVLAFATGCTEPVSRDSGARILVMGDSMIAAHGATGQSVGHAIERDLGEPVTDRAVFGARHLYSLPISGAAGLSIPRQYREGNWDWVVLNGGGNDLLFGCGCGGCARQIDRLISTDGRRGRIPGLVSRLRQGGARVIYVGYMRTPGVRSPVEGCVDEGDEMDRRLAALAALDGGVYFLSLADLVPHGDRSYHGLDLVHPSPKASAEIGARIARLIAVAEASGR